MKFEIHKACRILVCTSVMLGFSSGAFAADWSWAEDEIINSNFGQAAGWVIDSVVFEGGDEYLVDDGLAVCRDYLITVEKHRFANPQGRGKEQVVTEVEIETFCQPAEEA